MKPQMGPSMKTTPKTITGQVPQLRYQGNLVDPFTTAVRTLRTMGTMVIRLMTAQHMTARRYFKTTLHAVGSVKTGAGAVS